MRVSPFTPIFFIERRADGLDSDYLQVFSTKDTIRLQILCGPSEEAPQVYLKTHNEDGTVSQRYLLFAKVSMSTMATVYLNGLTIGIPGIYTIEITDYGESQPFMVTNDEKILEETVLIQYWMKDNRQRTDAIFIQENDRVTFNFRVHGGFKDSNWTFSVDSEQYTDEYSNTIQLYGIESTQKKFTMGNSDGVPIWYGEFLNRILCCNYFFIDGEQYVRKETSVPEATQTMDGVNSFTFLQMLQKSTNIGDEFQYTEAVYLRRIDGEEDYRDIEDNSIRVIV